MGGFSCFCYISIVRLRLSSQTGNGSIGFFDYSRTYYKDISYNDSGLITDSFSVPEDGLLLLFTADNIDSHDIGDEPHNGTYARLFINDVEINERIFKTIIPVQGISFASPVKKGTVVKWMTNWRTTFAFIPMMKE